MIKPMLGINVDLNKLEFPVYASTKLDGVRAIVNNGIVYSRTGKPIPNKEVQKRFSKVSALRDNLTQLRKGEDTSQKAQAYEEQLKHAGF